MSVIQTFLLPSSTTATFYLNSVSQGSNGTNVLGGKLVCFTQP